MLIIDRAYASDQHPGYTGGFIGHFAVMPQHPNLIGQFIINQQGFDVGFGEHSARVSPGLSPRQPNNCCLLVEMKSPAGAGLVIGPRLYFVSR